jgi:molecular chaperone DnaK
MLTPAERAEMKGRFDTIRRLEAGRKELDSLLRRMDELVERAAGLDCRAMAAEWKRRFHAYERSMASYVLQKSDNQPLYDMFNHAREAEETLTLNSDQVEHLKKSCAEFAETALKLNATAENYADSLNMLLEGGRALEQSHRQLVDERSQLYSRFADWNAVLAGLVLRVADARLHFITCYEVGDYRHAVAAFRGLPSLGDDPALIARYLDSLAQTRDREGYRRVLAEQGVLLGCRTVDFNRLNDFCKTALPALAWIKVDSGDGSRTEGSGFLVAADLVATNRHVLAHRDSERPIVPCTQVRIQLDGEWRTIEEVILPGHAELDVALVRLSQPAAAIPLRLGYANLAELGERVLALGFPLAEGDSFHDNISVDSGIINRFRHWPGTEFRHFEVGIRAAPGMSGGPLFNDAGEVIGIITTVTRWTLTAHSPDVAGPYSGQLSNALAVDPLRELLSVSAARKAVLPQN